jgi:ribosomal protein S18 acetylase RimI-like enzyme
LIRAGTPHDVEAVLDFWVLHAEGTDRRDSAAVVLELLDRDPSALLIAVAEQDGAIVGTVIAGWDGWRAHLYRLAVREDLRGRGIARSLVSAAEQRLVALGARRIDAMVLDDNTEGQAAWPALGYVVQPEWSRWVKHV